MKARVEQADGSYTWKERGEPVCGRDFCDTCGDCLHCYGGDPCWRNGKPDDNGHSWVVYKEDDKEARNDG